MGECPFVCHRTSGGELCVILLVEEVPLGCFQQKSELFVFQKRIGYKNNTKQKGFLRERVVFTMLISGKVIWEERRSS